MSPPQGESAQHEQRHLVGEPRATGTLRLPSGVSGTMDATAVLTGTAARFGGGAITDALSPRGEGELAWAPPSWDEIVQAHGARVYRLAYRLAGNQYDAEDITQD